MNLEFVQMLQSIAEVEKNPYFRSKKYVIVDKEERLVDPGSGAVPVVLKHPDNVIVVASPTGKAPPKAVGEVRVDQLSKAIRRASILSSLGDSGCSIVVHEGMYVDPMVGLGENGMFELDWTSGFSLEIIGTEEVRIVITSRVHPFAVRGYELTLKNLSIYDPLKISQIRVAMAMATAISAKMTMVDVRMHRCWGAPPAHQVLEQIYGAEKSELRVVDCAFSNTGPSFMLYSSKAEFRNCRWFHETGYGSCVHVSMVGSIVSFHQCQFMGKRGESKNHSSAIFVKARGQVDMTESVVSGFTGAFEVCDSYSRAALQRCKLLNCRIAVCSAMNSNVLLADCELAVQLVLSVQLNEKGKIMFRNNTLVPNTTPEANFYSSAMAVIRADREPKVVDHDFVQARIEIAQYPEGDDHSVGAAQNSRAEYSKWTKDQGFDSRAVCLYCKELEKTENPDAKFQHCARCRKVCYCSKECQLAHWRDHKLVCKKH